MTEDVRTVYVHDWGVGSFHSSVIVEPVTDGPATTLLWILDGSVELATARADPVTLRRGDLVVLEPGVAATMTTPQMAEYADLSLADVWPGQLTGRGAEPLWDLPRKGHVVRWSDEGRDRFVVDRYEAGPISRLIWVDEGTVTVAIPGRPDLELLPPQLAMLSPGVEIGRIDKSEDAKFMVLSMALS